MSTLRRILVSLFFLGLAIGVLTFAVNVSVAAPLGHGADAIIKANATLNLVEQAHGTHRACVLGRVPRWGVVRFHRHVGPAHAPVRC